MTFKLNAKQQEAMKLLAGSARHVLLRGGSRSGKTFMVIRAIVMRALMANGSRHAVLRYRFNACKQSVVYDTLPKVMKLCFPDVEWKLDKVDWFAKIGDSQIWFGGLDDKERAEKILGQEHATIFLNECSQIPYNSVLLANTRLAQRAEITQKGFTGVLPLKMIYDCNPPNNLHWTFRLFMQGLDPETKQALPNPDSYVTMQINPADNVENVAEGYLDELKNMPMRMQKRFLLGEFADANPDAVFSGEMIDRWRVRDQTDMPDLQRIVVAVDPSGIASADGSGDAVGICVAGLGVDGVGYCLEDLTVKASPKVWGNIVVNAYERHDADLIAGETNYGGAMVKQVIDSVRWGLPFRALTASRGKVVRAEPIGSLVEQGKWRLVGFFPELEEEMSGFTTAAYIGDNSPNRADAMIWAAHALFNNLTAHDKKRNIGIVLPAVNYFKAREGTRNVYS